MKNEMSEEMAADLMFIASANTCRASEIDDCGKALVAAGYAERFGTPHVTFLRLTLDGCDAVDELRRAS